MKELPGCKRRERHNPVFLSDTKPVYDKGGNQDVKRKLIACLLALVLCASLCACGAMRSGAGMKDRDTTRDTEMNGRGTTNGAGTNGGGMISDTDDGVVEDGSAADGIVDDERPMSSPNVTRNP